MVISCWQISDLWQVSKDCTCLVVLAINLFMFFYLDPKSEIKNKFNERSIDDFSKNYSSDYSESCSENELIQKLRNQCVSPLTLILSPIQLLTTVSPTSNNVTVTTNSKLEQPKSESIVKHLSNSFNDKEAAAPILECRANSVVGTLEYMAPEVVIMFGKRTLNKDGYTAAVDFWSLGILIFKLLTGTEPYNKTSYEYLQSIMPTHLSKYKNYYEAFTALFGELNFDAVEEGLSYDTQDLLYGLLEFNPDHRLGYNANTMQHGHDTLMNHAFFKNIDWALLESKQVPPPYIPTNEILECMCTTNNTPKTLPELLVSVNKSHWCEEFKSPDDLSCIETNPSSIIAINGNKIINNDNKYKEDFPLY